MNKSEKLEATKTTKKCKDIRNEARIELEKWKEWFNISSCKSFVEEREKKFEEFNKDQKTQTSFRWPSKEERVQFIKQEIETCEIWYALQKWCDILKDDTKKQKCENIEDFQKKLYEVERFSEFRIEDYVK